MTHNHGDDAELSISEVVALRQAELREVHRIETELDESDVPIFDFQPELHIINDELEHLEYFKEDLAQARRFKVLVSEALQDPTVPIESVVLDMCYSIIELDERIDKLDQLEELPEESSEALSIRKSILSTALAGVEEDIELINQRIEECRSILNKVDGFLLPGMSSGIRVFAKNTNFVRSISVPSRTT